MEELRIGHAGTFDNPPFRHNRPALKADKNVNI